MKYLSLINLSQNDQLICPDEFFDITLDSPAVKVMTDFHKERPHIIDANLTAIEAQSFMANIHVNILLVVDENLTLVGLVSPDVLTEAGMVRLVAQGNQRADILVGDVMLPRYAIKAMDYALVCQSTIRDIVHTLESSGHRYCLVVDGGKHQVCGLFNSNEIARRTHTPVIIEQRSSLADIVAAITH